MSDQKPLSEIKVDRDNLYREETFSDLRVATLRRMVPIKADGSPDDSRPVLFMGETQLMSAGGLLPVSCPIEASTLEDAIAKFEHGVAWKLTFLHQVHAVVEDQPHTAVVADRNERARDIEETLVVEFLVAQLDQIDAAFDGSGYRARVGCDEVEAFFHVRPGEEDVTHG